MSEPKEMTMGEAVKQTGCYLVLWRHKQKDAARVVGHVDDEEKVVFELISGPDKGKTRKAKYDPLQQVKVYDEDSVLMAVLDK